MHGLRQQNKWVETAYPCSINTDHPIKYRGFSIGWYNCISKPTKNCQHRMSSWKISKVSLHYSYYHFNVFFMNDSFLKIKYCQETILIFKYKLYYQYSTSIFHRLLLSTFTFFLLILISSFFSSCMHNAQWREGCTFLRANICEAPAKKDRFHLNLLSMLTQTHQLPSDTTTPHKNCITTPLLSWQTSRLNREHCHYFCYRGK